MARAMTDSLAYVLIINWNGLEHLEECFTSLLRGSRSNVRCLLVDNGSTDGSVEFVRERFGSEGRVEILELGENLGWSGGNNRGMEHALAAGADYIMLLNNDTAVEPEAVERLTAAMEERPGAGALAAKMLLYDEPQVLNSLGIDFSIIGVGWDRGLGRIDGPWWDDPEQVASACGGACMYRAEALHQVGLLPSDYGMYLDDLELGLRMWSAGWEVWTCPSARVRHKFSATMGTGRRAARKHYLNTRNRFRLMQRMFPVGSLVGAVPSVAVGEARALGRAALNGEWNKVPGHPRAWFAALGYAPRALAARSEMRRRGCRVEQIAPFIRKAPLFFPGIEIPKKGWYAERNGLRPMAARAVLDDIDGAVRCELVNRHPHVAPPKVDVYAGEARIAALDGEDAREVVLQPHMKPVVLVSRRIFRMEETGEPTDAGGWLRMCAPDGSEN
jgi:hypothetical protein